MMMLYLMSWHPFVSSLPPTLLLVSRNNDWLTNPLCAHAQAQTARQEASLAADRSQSVKSALQESEAARQELQENLKGQCPYRDILS